MKIKYFIYCLLGLVLLSIYGFCILHIANGGTKLGIATKPLKQFALLPKLITDRKDPLKEKWHANNLSKAAIYEIDTSEHWTLQGLSSEYDIQSDTWIIKELDFRSNEIIHEWTLDNKQLGIEHFQFAFINLPIKLADNSLILFVHASNNLLRIDADSKIIWQNNDFKFHHGSNLSADGQLWITAYTYRNIFNKVSNSWSRYLDDLLLKIDINTGETIFERSLADILIANDKKTFIYNYCNNYQSGEDPLHTNDIQPALSTETFWNQDDLFLSVRNRSAIIQYRPSNDSIIQIIQGPFTNQHDVDLISDTEIALFNNNMYMLGTSTDLHPTSGAIDTLGLSQILTYNLATEKFDTLLNNQFTEENIFSASQGCYEIFPSGNIFVESQNDGLLYFFVNGKLVLKRTLATTENNAIAKPHWIRVWSE